MEQAVIECETCFYREYDERDEPCKTCFENLFKSGKCSGYVNAVWEDTKGEEMMTKDQCVDLALSDFSSIYTLRDITLDRIRQAWNAGYHTGKEENDADAIQKAYDKGVADGENQALGITEDAEDAYARGTEDAWRFAQFLYSEATAKDKMVHYGIEPSGAIIKKYTFDEAKAMWDRSVETNTDVFIEIFGRKPEECMIDPKLFGMSTSWWDEPYEEPKT